MIVLPVLRNIEKNVVGFLQNISKIQANSPVAKPFDKMVKLPCTDRLKITLHPQMVQLNQYGDQENGRSTRRPVFDS